MGLGVPLDTPFYLGAGSGTDQSARWQVSLGGVAYALDTKTTPLRHASVPLLRAAQDDLAEPGKKSLNPEAFWRRSFESWHVGAGQTHFDRDDSNPWRFRRSKGVNVWDRNQVSLLNATDAKTSSANTNLYLAVAGSYLYETDGTALKYTQDITPDTPTFTTVTGTPATAPSDLASDGFNVLTAHAASGIYKTTRGAATTASQLTGTVQRVAYGKGRWVATNGPTLYDITTAVTGAPGALPAAFYTQPNTDWVWNSFAEGPSAFYVGGFSGDKSLIYRLTMKEDGTGLNQPVVAGTLPDGEILRSMQGYLGFVLLGTSKGVRVAVPASNADLNIGAFIPTDNPVLCFEGQDRFVWFGWTSFEASDSGLGRVDLKTFSDVDALAPAYATDLMSGVTGDVQAVVTFQNLRVFTVSGHGIYAEDTSKLAATGQIDSGLFDFGLIDQKLSLFVDMTHINVGGSHSIYLSIDRGTFALLATMTSDNFPVGTGEARGNEFEIRIVLNRDGVTPTVGPTVRSWAMRVQPTTRFTEEIIAPLLIAPSILTLDGELEAVDSAAAFDHIVSLCDSKEIVQYREGNRTWSVIVADYQCDAVHVWGGPDVDRGINGTCVTRMKVVA